LSEYVGLRGRVWFRALTGNDQPRTGDPGSVLTADSQLGRDTAVFLCVVPNPDSRFPCVRDGQVGLEEAYALAARIREAIDDDRDKPKAEKRPIIAIIDVKNQAYGRREETAGIFLAAAASADAYASARMTGHPVISLVVGHAFSGGFLTHSYQANRILAFDDSGVTIHAMHKEAAARITRRSVSDLERLGHQIAPMSYDVRDYAKLGTLYRLLHVNNPTEPMESEIVEVKQAIAGAIADARMGAEDLSNRLNSAAAKETRKASRTVRALMEKEWATA
jgi:malonate decarboxylase gamma subunit